MEKNRKQYRAIVKVGPKAFVKYHVNDLVAFTRFLDREYPGWRFFNVFRHSQDDAGEQLASFTPQRRPTHKHLTDQLRP